MTITTLFFRLISYAKYYIKAQSDLYIHSPFIYEWMKHLMVFRAKSFSNINRYRASLDKNTNSIAFNNQGEEKITTVRDRYMNTSISDDYGKILQATASYIKASNFLELGTSLGVSTAYIHATNSHIEGITIDANSQTSTLASFLFDSLLSPHKVTFEIGFFKDVIHEILNKTKPIDFVFIDGDHKLESTLHYLEMLMPNLAENAVVVLDDIRWSPDMYKAWLRACLYTDFNYAIDFGRMGILFKVNNHSPKQYFTIH
jgi:predicted O-methyltransferase YrrM